MPRGLLVPLIYWICFIGLVAWALTADLLQDVTSPLGRENNSKQHAQTRQTDKAENHAAKQSLPPSVVTQGENSIETDWGKPNCKSPQNHDEADLCQQRRMADIAEYTLGVGVLTIIGLALTVYYARTAAFAAVEAAKHGRTAAIGTVDATNAAQESIRLAEKTAEQQLRAYVTITKAEIRTDGDVDDPYISAIITFINSGQTPAYNFRIWIEIEICRHDEPPFASVREGDFSSSILGPGSTASAQSEWKPVAGMREEIIVFRGSRVFVWGQAQYTSMGKARTFTFRAWNGFELNDISDIDEDWGGWVLVPHPMGYGKHIGRPLPPSLRGPCRALPTRPPP